MSDGGSPQIFTANVDLLRQGGGIDAIVEFVDHLRGVLRDGAERYRQPEGEDVVTAAYHQTFPPSEHTIEDFLDGLATLLRVDGGNVRAAGTVLDAANKAAAAVAAGHGRR